ncbi:MAG: hemolysin family protein [Paraprevotella sp.]|nr:hemolysin family protein [Paraprevotella sp.]
MTTLIEIVITLLFSAFSSGMEIAFVSSDKLRIELDRSNGGLTYRILSVFYSRPNDFISTLLVGNNIALVIYGILMADVINHYIFAQIHLSCSEGVQVVLQIILSTLIVLVTGEFLPKTIFRIDPNRILALLAVPAFIVYVVLYPISKFTSALSRGLLRLIGCKINKKASEQAFTKVDLDNLIQSSIDPTRNDNGVVDEVKIFQNALSFSETKVRDCMVPRTEIKAVEVESSMENLKNRFIESGKSKIIVYKEDIDHIVGFIHSSEMFRNPTDWTSRIKKIPAIPESMSASKLLKRFMQQKKSLAVVVDEFGGTAGLVSMEDLVEEIFGEIEDEHDNTHYVAQKTGENEYILSGRLEIEQANKLLGLNLPESEEYVTVSGLILHQYQSFPKQNEIIRFNQFEFKIIKNTTTKIELVRLKIIK